MKTLKYYYGDILNIKFLKQKGFELQRNIWLSKINNNKKK